MTDRTDETLPRADEPVWPGTDAPPSGDPVMLTLLKNILAGTRLALMLPVRKEAFRGSIHQAVLLILATIVVLIVAQFFETAPRRQFNMFGLSSVLTGFCAVLLAAYCSVGVQRATATLATFLVFVVSTFPVVNVVWTLVRVGVPPEILYTWAYMPALIVSVVWPLMIAYRAVRMIHEAEPAKALVVGGIYAALVVAPAFLLPTVPLWTSLGPPAVASDEDSSADYRPVDVEAAYYRQARLLDDAVKTLHRHRPGVADLYFVGFGGYAHQDVFLREVQSVHGLFDERFDTANRSVELINNPATLEDTPLANAHNLERVLENLARRMDVDEDILFLFLTSHGSRDHRLSAEFWPLGLNDLPAEELADILDRAGIKWRVIVVSACFSGGFLDSLADENSLVIAAARRDRQSFGCAHENEWTYFGQAYFDEQLRHEYSFTDAFDAAVAAIAAREEAEELTPSEPQIHVGTAIADRLETLQARIEAGSMAASTN